MINRKGADIDEFEMDMVIYNESLDGFDMKNLNRNISIRIAKHISTHNIVPSVILMNKFNIEKIVSEYHFNGAAEIARERLKFRGIEVLMVESLSDYEIRIY